MMNKNHKSFICGLKGKYLSNQEKKFLTKHKPWGVILFSRNISSIKQTKNLTNSIKKIFKNNNYPILIDEEGGRVTRLKKFIDSSLFSAKYFGDLYKKNNKKFEIYFSVYVKQISYLLRSLGININYEIQEKPEGIAQALIIGKKFIKESNVTLILGDNMFHGNYLIDQLQKSFKVKKGATIFAYPVSDPERYGVVEFDSNGKAYKVEEKPVNPRSKFAITGLYFYDSTAVAKAETLKPSERGELEITDLNNLYMKDGELMVEKMNRGMTWLDTGTLDSLHEASSYIRSLEKRQGLKIGCPEEIAWRMGFIDDNELSLLAENLLKSGYGDYLKSIIEEKRNL